MTKFELMIEDVEHWCYDEHEDLPETTDYEKGFKEGISHAKKAILDITHEDKDRIRQKSNLLDSIIAETRNRYENMAFFQRPELSKEELLECAEEMRMSLETIRELANGDDY